MTTIVGKHQRERESVPLQTVVHAQDNLGICLAAVLHNVCAGALNRVCNGAAVSVPEGLTRTADSTVINTGKAVRPEGRGRIAFYKAVAEQLVSIGRGVIDIGNLIAIVSQCHASRPSNLLACSRTEPVCCHLYLDTVVTQVGAVDKHRGVACSGVKALVGKNILSSLVVVVDATTNTVIEE